MAAVHSFRTAFRGFHREDVVQYIEYLNNTHNAKIEQLNNQLQALREELAQAKSAPADNGDLRAQLDAALARCNELEQQSGNGDAAELAAYRRAERAERMAQERAAQVYDQINAVLADATVKVDATSQQIGTVADQLAAQLQTYQETVESTKATLQEAVSSLYAIRPEE